jgi:hypothetical protein
VTPELRDGWYLMTTADLEMELRRWRSPEEPLPASGAEPLSVEQAIAFRDAGNIPDEHDRTLRLVLRIEDTKDLANLDARRVSFEPDYHEAPRWRREGSRPINVVPLRRPDVGPVTTSAWWEEPALEALEQEFQTSGTAAGVHVPGEYRAFVFKTILALRAQSREVTPQTISDSIARWLPEADARRVARSLAEANH